MTKIEQLSRHANPAENAFEKTVFWRVKVWLQFTGWLLYLANFVIVLIMLFIVAFGSWIGVWPILLVWVPLGFATFLALNLCFDIVTVRYSLRPKEALPKPNTHQDVFDLMRERVSCRSFQARDLTEQHFAELMKTVDVHSKLDKQLGTLPIRFEYVNAPLTVWPVVGCRQFLVAIAPKEYNRLSVIDVGRSLQKIVLHATRMGLSTCWIGPGADQKSIVYHLGDRFDQKIDHVICVCALGYASRFRPMALRGMQKAQRNRLPLEKLFFSDTTFSKSLDTTSAPFAIFKRCFEVCQWAPSSYNGQTTRCASISEQLGAGATLVRFDFCTATHSKYYAAVALGIWLANWEIGCKSLGQKGHFEILPSEKRQIKGAPELPNYDVSWILD